ncbi:hypothetical protein D187_001557 [Cystobacter fuscus DSM 2262]|uniref:Uncharacterized protein n=1 Tax=Cystobacter fuscus (strain ATCC 25194 / DSM 2262 / NBRC 100088 / M29) TaxID=1242864 RepID=S9P8Z1_CYSF2|nr:hypothetical protein D187_001557 [Cystobacter fuscus DSM 2262]
MHGAPREQIPLIEVVTNPAAWREHLIALDEAAFERISGVRPAEVLRSMYQWDRQLGAH